MTTTCWTLPIQLSLAFGRGMTDGDRAKPASLGLIGLEERLLSVGGSLHIAAAAFGGTRLSAVIPRPATHK